MKQNTKTSDYDPEYEEYKYEQEKESNKQDASYLADFILQDPENRAKAEIAEKKLEGQYSAHMDANSLVTNLFYEAGFEGTKDQAQKFFDKWINGLDDKILDELYREELQLRNWMFNRGFTKRPKRYTDEMLESELAEVREKIKKFNKERYSGLDLS